MIIALLFNEKLFLSILVILDIILLKIIFILIANLINKVPIIPNSENMINKERGMFL